jgi:hypothetical protein
MFRKILAVLLVISLTVLAGLDVLEDLEPPSVFELQRSTAASIPIAGPSGSLANNIVESASSLNPQPSAVLERPIVEQQTIEVPPLFQRTSKLHKRKRVFLI